MLPYINFKFGLGLLVIVTSSTMPK